MITTPVAVARCLIVTAVAWAGGAVVVAVLFATFHGSRTIEFSGQDRAQTLWLGANAFVVCVAALLGVGLGGTALSRSGLASPLRSAGTVTGVVLVPAVVALLVMLVVGTYQSSTLAAEAVGLLIGAGAGAFLVVHDDAGEAGLPFAQPPARRAGRGWGSRG